MRGNGAAKRRRQAPKVLMVDDEAPILMFYEAELADEGYDVVTATSGQEALELFASEKPDAVTLDIMLPMVQGGRLRSTVNPTGIRLLQQMKGMDGSIPVIMLTAFDYTDKMKNLPSDGYVVKSSDTDELKSLLERLVRRKEETRG
ncbi:MAG: response regulator [Nitrospirota bacterium]